MPARLKKGRAHSGRESILARLALECSVDVYAARDTDVQSLLKFIGAASFWSPSAPSSRFGGGDCISEIERTSRLSSGQLVACASKRTSGPARRARRRGASEGGGDPKGTEDSVQCLCRGFFGRAQRPWGRLRPRRGLHVRVLLRVGRPEAGPVDVPAQQLVQILPPQRGFPLLLRQARDGRGVRARRLSSFGPLPESGVRRHTGAPELFGPTPRVRPPAPRLHP